MFDTIEGALNAVRARSSEDDYRLACEYLVEHRDQLTQRVFINLPGGLNGNTNAVWDVVKVNSIERCSCGNERVIIPLNPRTVYKSSGNMIVVAKDKPVYLKPIGGDKTSAFLRLETEDRALTILEDPLAPLVLTVDLFSTKGFTLQQLAEAMAEHSDPPVFVRFFDGVPTPIFAINSVNAEAEAVTITPDAAVEAFDPDVMPDHECA